MFRPNGTITAGNACPLNDGAAAVVIMSDTKAKELGLTPLARIVATGCPACRRRSWAWARSRRRSKALANAGMTISDIDLFEINEAFAVQVLGSARELGIDEDKLNVSGGAIALGHPFGMTGARITATLLNNLHDLRQDVRPGDDVRRRRPGHGDDHRAARLIRTLTLRSGRKSASNSTPSAPSRSRIPRPLDSAEDIGRMDGGQRPGYRPAQLLEVFQSLDVVSDWLGST